MNRNKNFLSTAIPFVNAKPHLGHALEFVEADTTARFWRARGGDVFFLTGADENAMKNVQAAEEAGVAVRDFISANSKLFMELAKAYNLSHSDFIRTSEEKRHKDGAQKLWQSLKPGDVYKKKYRGLYCVGCEEFKLEKDLIDGRCAEHPNGKLEILEEENYFFKLSNYAKKLEDLIGSGAIKIIPESRKNEALGFIRAGLQDFSISRTRERTKNWGIEVPGDAGQMMYVWVDALSNYINALGYAAESKNFNDYWTDAEKIVHFIGKGINRFHTIYWPALLLSAGIRVPTTVFIHGYITIGGQKMSKSLGNVIDPFEFVKKFGVDAVRYYLLREIPAYEDGDVSESRFRERYNADLSNGLGNFAARVSTLTEKLGKFGFNAEDIEKEVETVILKTKKEVGEKMELFKFNEALASIWELLSFGDRYVNEKKPWADLNKRTIANLVAILDNIAVLIQPFIPETAAKITASISWISESQLEIKKIPALFPRL